MSCRDVSITMTKEVPGVQDNHISPDWTIWRSTCSRTMSSLLSSSREGMLMDLARNSLLTSW